ncbi:MAG TPA: efflux RND transporter periplasmic adaptor subunit [Porticoccaceae bacterium]
MNKWFGVFVLTLAVCTGLWLKSEDRQPPVREHPQPYVRVVPVGYSSLEESLDGLGTVHAKESLEITARVTSTVKRVHFTDNAEVKEGDVLIELDDARERAALREAQVLLHEEQRLLAHYQALQKTQAVSRTMLEEQQAKVAAAEARVAAAEALLAEYVIVAPFSGVLGVRQVSQGALVSPGTLITTLDALDIVKVDFTVPERWISQLLPGQTITASSVAWPGRTFVGMVSSIGTRVDAATRAVSVRARIDNDESLLRPGMLLNIHLASEPRDALVVSEAALIQEGSERYVFVVDEDNVVTRRPVEIGQREGGLVEVVNGLSPEEKIIIEGSQKVRDGVSVQLASDNGSESTADGETT